MDEVIRTPVPEASIDEYSDAKTREKDICGHTNA
jgi:hypothetical protein